MNFVEPPANETANWFLTFFSTATDRGGEFGDKERELERWRQ